MIDIAPTVLEAAGLPEPKVVNGTPQTPIQGVSMMYTFDAPKAKSTHTTQYFEIFGNRGIYSDGWLAGTVHKAPWEARPREPLTADVWELYDTTKDFSLTNNLAASNPAKLKEMQELFIKEAIANNVLPIDDRGVERVNAAVAGRPDLMAGRTSLTLYEGMKGISENVFINVKNTSLSITADVDIPQAGAKGVIIAQAGRFGGWSLYLKDGKPTYTYNYLGLQRFTVALQGLSPPAKRLSALISLTTVAWAKEAREASQSMVKRLPKDESNIPSAVSFLRMKAPTSVRTTAPRSAKTTKQARPATSLAKLPR